MTRTSKRNEFLTDLLTTAIENGGHGWFYVIEYRWESVEPGEAFAVIEPEDDEGTKHRVDLDVLARGLGVIRDAVLREVDDFNGKNEVLHNAKTGERLYLSQPARRGILLADRTNGDEGDLDVVDALAVLECGLFGQVVYA